MGMHGLLLAMSKARVEMLQGDESLLREVIDSRGERTIPGLLSLGKTWDALDVLLSDRGREPLLGDAVCARTGIALGPDFGFGRGRLVPQMRTKQIADALTALPKDTVRSGYAKLRGENVHGGYGPKNPAPQSAGSSNRMIDDYKKNRAEPDAAIDELESFARTVLAMPEDTSEEEAEIGELEKKLREVVALYAAARAKGQAVYAVVV